LEGSLAHPPQRPQCAPDRVVVLDEGMDGMVGWRKWRWGETTHCAEPESRLWDVITRKSFGSCRESSGWLLECCCSSGEKRQTQVHMVVFGWNGSQRREQDNDAQCGSSRSHFSPHHSVSKAITGKRESPNSPEGRSAKMLAVLTCKSIVKFGYRGETQIEPSGSWFPPKFSSG
jgi:hypothetical protein